MINKTLKNITINDTFRKMKKEFNEETAQRFYVVITTESYLIGVYSSMEKAESIVKMLGGKYDGTDLTICYEYLDDPISRMD